jgi:DHA1 family bicyclomycin/chloramphenicol resistance-like MFS transporter
MNAMAYIGYNQLNPWLVGRFGIAPVITIAGSVLLVACGALVVQVFLPPQPLGLVLALLVSEAGFGLVMPCAMVGALSRHQAHAGSASALLGTMQYTGGAIAGLAMGMLADGTARPMALAMGAASVAALLAAAARPALSFGVTET